MTRSSALIWILGGVAVAPIASGCIDDPNQVGRIENRGGASGTLSNGGAYLVGGLGAIGGTSANGGNGNGGSIFTGGFTGIVGTGGTGGTIIVSGGIGTGGISGAGGSSTGGASGTGPVVDQLALGDFFSCAQLSDGTVRCWGVDDFGELGADTTLNGGGPEPCSSTPIVVQGLSGIVEIAAGEVHSCARLGDGTVKCWGYNSDGELGDGTTSGITCPETNSPASVCRLTPVVVQGLSSAVQIAARGGHSCALIGDGRVECWGLNSSGELGDGTTTNNPTPVVVQGLSGAVEIAAGGEAGSHTCALIGDGTVQCWGDNKYGELGDGTTTGSTCVPVQSMPSNYCRLTPVVVQGLSGAVEIAAGAYHSCARLGGGTVQCWGDNVAGQLGNGATSFSPTPVVVQDLSGAVEIAAGYYHSCARLGDGTVECWGDNGEGQLGDGATSGSTCYTGLINSSGPCQLTPVVVQGLSGAVEIRAGYHHSCARLGDGTVRCWGDNLFGELGDGTNTNSPTPVLVVGLP